MSKIILGDCLDIMQGMESKSVDLIVTDPPYGIGEALGKNNSRSKAFGSKSHAKHNTLKKIIPSIKYGRFEWDNSPPI
jgi:DNA modification methylase